MGADTKDPAKVAPKEQLVAATVARGRTVMDLDGKRHAAGAEVSLPAVEVARLRGRGFLIDPKKAVIKLVSDGPTFGSAGGPKVTIKRG